MQNGQSYGGGQNSASHGPSHVVQHAARRNTSRKRPKSPRGIVQGRSGTVQKNSAIVHNDDSVGEQSDDLNSSSYVSLSTCRRDGDVAMESLGGGLAAKRLLPPANLLRSLSDNLVGAKSVSCRPTEEYGASVMF
jgi:hypothetical protein